MTRFNLASRLRPPQMGGTLSATGSLQIQKVFSLTASALAVSGTLAASGNLTITGGGGGSGETLIPSSLLYDWSLAGVTGGIVNRSTVFTTLAAGSTASQMQTAINNCPSGQVIQLAAGTHTWTSAISFANKSNITIRGAGKGVTTINCTGSRAFNFTVGNTAADFPQGSYTGPALTVSAAKGDTVVQLSSTSTFAAGDRVVITLTNDTTLPVIGTPPPSSNNSRLRGFMTKVASKTSTTLTLQDPLPFACPTSLTPNVHIVASGFSSGVGLEGFTMDCGSGIIFGMTLYNTDGCWLKDVEVKNAANYQIYALNCLHMEMRRCTLTGAGGGGTNGSDLLLEFSSMCLVEDNIIGAAQPHIEMNFRCSGNVIAYNFFHTPVNEFGIDSNHGAHNSFNLFEGNVCYQIGSDGYFGSESEHVSFRNRVYGGGGGACFELNRFSRNFVAVENVLGQSSVTNYESTVNGPSQQPCIYRLGYPNLGNDNYSGSAPPWADGTSGSNLPTGYQERDTGVSSTILRKRNYCSTSAGIPAGEAQTSTEPASLFRSSKPSWFNSLNWPAYGTGGHTTFGVANSDFQKIPAGYRYFNSGADPA